MKNKKTTIAVFDFDGTITRTDTFRDFFIWSFGPLRFYAAFFLTSPLIALYILGLLRNDFPKSALFSLFFRKCPAENYHSLCRDYAKNRIPEVIRPSALDRIKWHKDRGHTLIINSASLSDWIRPWAIENSFDHIIATGAQIENSVLTGGFDGFCSYGQEKVVGLQRLKFTKENFYIYAYGDSKGDQELLSVADVAEFRAFH